MFSHVYYSSCILFIIKHVRKCQKSRNQIMKKLAEFKTEDLLISLSFDKGTGKSIVSIDGGSPRSFTYYNLDSARLRFLTLISFNYF